MAEKGSGIQVICVYIPFPKYLNEFRLILLFGVHVERCRG
jgi:hypothetical protein